MTINVTDTVGANNTIVLDSNSKIPAIDGSQVTALVATAFTTGTLATARIDTGTTAGKILQLDGSARIPAISGANLTNVPGPTVSTSDPAVDTNPTLGKKWINKTSGEVYICTDATAGENVWTNVGAGSGNIVPWFYGGTQYGYTCGGRAVNTPTDLIDKYSFSSTGNATDVGNLLANNDNITGHHSKTYGYSAGGGVGGGKGNVIQKFSFSADANATDVGDLVIERGGSAGNSTEDYAYSQAGYVVPVTQSIDKFAFASDGNATTISGVVTVARQSPGEATSTTHCYAHGGHGVPGGPAGQMNIIDKFAVATEANSTDVGDLDTGVDTAMCGASSSTYGYAVGGHNLYGVRKYSFTTDGNSVDSFDLTNTSTRYCAGSSSTTHGYRAGGNGASHPSCVNTIDNFPFASDTNATDVGDLLIARRYIGGQSY